MTVIELVGPKGYIHGWIFVGIPAPGDKVNIPGHGHGKVISGNKTHARVKLNSGHVAAIKHDGDVSKPGKLTQSAKSGPVPKEPESELKAANRKVAEASMAKGHETLFHGTMHEFKPGDIIDPNHANAGVTRLQGKQYAFASTDPGEATFAGKASRAGGHVYRVEPVGDYEFDPHQGTSTSRRNTGGFRVVEEVKQWSGEKMDKPFSYKSMTPAQKKAYVNKGTVPPGMQPPPKRVTAHANLLRAVELASAGGHHIAGTPYTYSHGWKPRDIGGGKKEIVSSQRTADKMGIAALKQHMNTFHAGLPDIGRRVGPRNPSKAHLLAAHEAMHADSPLSVNPPGTADTSALKGAVSRIGIAHTHGNTTGMAGDREAVELAGKAGSYRPPAVPRYQPTGVMRKATAASMRKLAGQLKTDHQGIGAHVHVTDAARALERGNTDAANRHLTAAVGNMTPQSMMRHGFVNDEDHMKAKASMDAIHRHILLVKDIADTQAQNRALPPAGNGTADTAPNAPVPSPRPGNPRERAMNAPATTNSGGSDENVAKPQQVTEWKVTKQIAASTSGDLTTAVELAGPYRYRHGWIKINGTDPRQKLIGALKKAKATVKSVENEKMIGEEDALPVNGTATRGGLYGKMQHANALPGIELSAQTGALASVPHPFGKPGGPGLWGVKNMELPPYVQNIAHALLRTGRAKDLGEAIAMAKGATSRWAHGKNTSPEVRAASVATNADWAAKRAIAHAHANARAAVELVGPKGYSHGWVYHGPGKGPTDPKSITAVGGGRKNWENLASQPPSRSVKRDFPDVAKRMRLITPARLQQARDDSTRIGNGDAPLHPELAQIWPDVYGKAKGVTAPLSTPKAPRIRPDSQAVSGLSDPRLDYIKATVRASVAKTQGVMMSNSAIAQRIVELTGTAAGSQKDTRSAVTGQYVPAGSGGSKGGGGGGNQGGGKSQSQGNAHSTASTSAQITGLKKQLSSLQAQQKTLQAELASASGKTSSGQSGSTTSSGSSTTSSSAPSTSSSSSSSTPSSSSSSSSSGSSSSSSSSANAPSAAQVAQWGTQLAQVTQQIGQVTAQLAKLQGSQSQGQ